MSLINERLVCFGVRSSAAHAVVRITLGSVLLVAAGLKAYQLATQPSLDTDLFASRWPVIGIVVFESHLAAWLLSGTRQWLAWRVSILTFAVFAAISLYQALAGTISCGCLGDVSVNPWSMLVLDVTALGALLRWSSPPAVHASTPVAWLVPPIVAVLLGSAILMAEARDPILLDLDVHIPANGQPVLLQPNLWVGKPFPLMKYAEINAQLDEGEWIVLLYHSECHRGQVWRDPAYLQ